MEASSVRLPGLAELSHFWGTRSFSVKEVAGMGCAAPGQASGGVSGSLSCFLPGWVVMPEVSNECQEELSRFEIVAQS